MKEEGTLTAAALVSRRLKKNYFRPKSFSFYSWAFPNVNKILKCSSIFSFSQ